MIKLTSGERIKVDCSKCNFCLQNRRKDWMFRLEQHSKDYVSAHFITLTYDNHTVPTSNNLMTLRKTDLIKFHKLIKQSNTRTLIRLKKNKKLSWKQYHELKRKYRITYYSVGEYGSKFFRPHYHCLMFGIHPLTIQALKRNQVWNKGMIHIGTVSSSSIGYVTAYMIDKDNVRDGIREKPFSIMSKGIGANYLKLKRQWNKQKGDHLDDYRYYVIHDGHKQRLPRYYKDKIFTKVERSILSQIAFEESMNFLESEIERLIPITGSHLDAIKLIDQRKWNEHDLIRSKTQKLKSKFK